MKRETEVRGNAITSLNLKSMSNTSFVDNTLYSHDFHQLWAGFWNQSFNTTLQIIAKKCDVHFDAV